MNTLDQKSLRRAFGSFMTGVTVVTTVDQAGTPVGFTANSFSSVSLDPPLLLVCPAKSMSSFEIFSQCDYFHINVLAHDQQAVSNIFASNSDNRFSQVDWQNDANGCPKINNAIASFSCKRDRSIDAGDHIILLGEVLEFESHDKQGLGYSVGGYFSLNMERAAAELQATSQHDKKRLVVGAMVEHKGRLLLVPNVDVGDSLPQIRIEDEQPSFEAIDDYLQTLLQVPVEVSTVFSVFDHENQPKSSIYYRVRINDNLEPIVEDGVFIEMDDIANRRFSCKATSSLVTRYVAERSSGNHSLYVGTDAAGNTHKINTGSA